MGALHRAHERVRLVLLEKNIFFFCCMKIDLWFKTLYPNNNKIESSIKFLIYLFPFTHLYHENDWL